MLMIQFEQQFLALLNNSEEFMEFGSNFKTGINLIINNHMDQDKTLRRIFKHKLKHSDDSSKI